MRYFNENMTYFEAHKALYSLIKEKPENETPKIKQEYKKMLKIISNKERAEDKHCLTSYTM